MCACLLRFRKRERQRTCKHSPGDCSSQGRAEAGSPEILPGLPHRWQGHEHLGHLPFCFSHPIRKELDLKWGTGTRSSAHVRCWHCNSSFMCCAMILAPQFCFCYIKVCTKNNLLSLNKLLTHVILKYVDPMKALRMD